MENITLDIVKEKLGKYAEIGIIDKGLFSVIQYNVAFPTTFLPDGDELSHNIRMNSRGMVFDNQTGKLIRLPFHKFFNVGEKEHTQLELIEDEEILWVSDKLDGSLISPFIEFNHKTGVQRIIWGSKRISEEFHDYLVNSELTKNPLLEEFVFKMTDEGKTPIFEFHDPDFKPTCIVIKYPEAFLRLIGLRDMKTGEYIDIRTIDAYYDSLDKGSFREISTLSEIQNELLDIDDEEGRVIMLAKTGLVKMKTPAYVKKHKIKDMLKWDHIKAQLCLDINDSVSLDDILPDISPEEKVEFYAFTDRLHENIMKLCGWVEFISNQYPNKRDYGISKPDTQFSNLVFKAIENPNNTFSDVIAHLSKNLKKESVFNNWMNDVNEL
ncbi:MAG: RNA ligase [Ghiorsea sp.]